MSVKYVPINVSTEPLDDPRDRLLRFVNTPRLQLEPPPMVPSCAYRLNVEFSGLLDFLGTRVYCWTDGDNTRVEAHLYVPNRDNPRHWIWIRTHSIWFSEPTGAAFYEFVAGMLNTLVHHEVLEGMYKFRGDPHGR